jgi:hypothetical protein
MGCGRPGIAARDLSGTLLAFVNRYNQTARPFNRKYTATDLASNNQPACQRLHDKPPTNLRSHPLSYRVCAEFSWGASRESSFWQLVPAPPTHWESAGLVSAAVVRRRVGASVRASLSSAG